MSMPKRSVQQLISWSLVLIHLVRDINMTVPRFRRTPDCTVTIQPFVDDILVIFHIRCGVSVGDEDILPQGFVVERKHIGGNLDRLSPFEIPRNSISDTLPQLFGS
jgi:hypothetical protein